MTIGEAAGVSNIRSVFQDKNLPNGLDELRWFTGITSITGWGLACMGTCPKASIPENVTVVNQKVFSGRTNLKKVTIYSRTFTSVGTDWFERMTNRRIDIYFINMTTPPNLLTMLYNTSVSFYVHTLDTEQWRALDVSSRSNIHMCIGSVMP